MSELERLQAELENKTRELASLTTRERTTVGDVDAVLDKIGKTVEYEGYKDVGRATQLIDEIDKIKKEIEAYPIKEEKLSPAMEERIRKANVGSIMRSAKEEYDKQMNEYMQKNFWGKAKTMFAGKKPIQNATSEQIIATYGNEAKNKEMQGELNRAEREFNQLVEWIKDYYQKHPEELTTSIEERIEQERKVYEERIKSIQAKNDSYLAEANEAVKGGMKL